MHRPPPPQYAFVTLVTSDHYLPGALVVAAALRGLHPSPPPPRGDAGDELDPREFHVVCVATPETVSVATLRLLRRAFDVVVGVEVIEAEEEGEEGEGGTAEALRLLGRPDLKTVLTKLHVLRLTSYRKIVYLDADVLPLQPLSHLFRRTSAFAAVPDVGWPDIFNSGVLVFAPRAGDFARVMRIVRAQGSWDGGDQGVLNEWRSGGDGWERLSFVYNTTPTGAYTYAPAYSRFGSSIKVIHFIGPNKPWTQAHLRASGPGQAANSSSENSPYAYSSLVDRWFAIFDAHYRSAAAPIFTAAGDLVPAASFSEGVYENLWDSRATGARRGSLPLELEELKRLALEGSGQTPTTVAPGEGSYMTLPLEGRLDLMPPRRSHFRPPPPLPAALPSSAAAGSSESHTPEAPVVTPTPFSGSEASNGGDQVKQDNTTTAEARTQWDPWTRPYPNAWDLIPGIVRHARQLSFLNYGKKDKTENDVDTRNNDKPVVYKSWEDKVESTSADGDDEAED